MWPNWMPQDMGSQEMKEALSKLGDVRVGALVVCARAREDSSLIEKATDVLKLDRNTKTGCAPYTPLDL